MNTFRFFDFPVYQLAKGLYKDVLAATEQSREFSLKDQVRRAALSVILNIAEGSARKSDKEFGHFLQLSLGSVSEVVACLDVMRDNFRLTQEEFDRLSTVSERIAKQLGGLYKRLMG